MPRGVTFLPKQLQMIAYIVSTLYRSRHLCKRLPTKLAKNSHQTYPSILQNSQQHKFTFLPKTKWNDIRDDDDDDDVELYSVT